MTQDPTEFGCLYGIGVGPGDPEQITLKALKALQKAPVICVPQAANRRDSYALTIVKDYVKPEQEILRAPFPTDDAEGAAAAYRRAHALMPDEPYIAAQRLAWQRRLCDWQDVDTLAAQVRAALAAAATALVRWCPY